MKQGLDISTLKLAFKVLNIKHFHRQVIINGPSAFLMAPLIVVWESVSAPCDKKYELDPGYGQRSQNI